MLFNLHRALESRSRTVILVEGFFDTLAVHQSGYPAVVSLMGSALSRWQTDLLSTHFDQVLLMLSALIILLPLVGCVLRQDGGVRADTQQLSDGTIRDILAHSSCVSLRGMMRLLRCKTHGIYLHWPGPAPFGQRRATW